MAFLTPAEGANEVLALDRYLRELEGHDITFAVKQRRPKTLEEAVASTLEMESGPAPN